MDNPTKEIIDSKLDSKLGPFTEELSVLEKLIKSRKAAGIEKNSSSWMDGIEIGGHNFLFM